MSKSNNSELVRKTIQTVYSMGLSEFKGLFGESMGSHLWHKWIDSDREAGRFICRLDEKNLSILVDNALSDNPIIETYCNKKPTEVK
jgi:hypothetical protein